MFMKFKASLKRIVKTNPLLTSFVHYLNGKYLLHKSLKFNSINNLSSEGNIQLNIKGKDNIINIQPGCILANTCIRLKGNQNKLTIHKNVYLGPNCKIYIEGNNCEVIIGSATTATRQVEFNAQENNSKIIIGEDCMFSNNITIRTSDSHPIYDTLTGNRINPPADVWIGSHVWIAPNTKVMKGARIGSNSIIASDTSVYKSVPENSLFAGRPGKVVKDNVRWTREALF